MNQTTIVEKEEPNTKEMFPRKEKKFTPTIVDLGPVISKVGDNYLLFIYFQHIWICNFLIDLWLISDCYCTYNYTYYLNSDLNFKFNFNFFSRNPSNLQDVGFLLHGLYRWLLKWSVSLCFSVFYSLSLFLSPSSLSLSLSLSLLLSLSPSSSIFRIWATRTSPAIPPSCSLNRSATSTTTSQIRSSRSTLAKFILRIQLTSCSHSTNSHNFPCNRNIWGLTLAYS